MAVSLLMEETGVPGENHRHVANDRQTLSHNVIRDSSSKSIRARPRRRTEIFYNIISSFFSAMKFIIQLKSLQNYNMRILKNR